MTILYKAFFLCLTLFFISCGSNGVASQTKRGVILDAGYVANIRYQCGETAGISDASGFFSYDSTVENCHFYLGTNYVSVGTQALADSIITPFELAGGLATGFEISRLLQSFGTLNDKVLTIDLAKFDLLQDIDLPNSFNMSTKIAATGAKAVTLEEAKDKLAQYYDLTTGKLLTQTQATTPVVITPPAETTIQPPVVPPAVITPVTQPDTPVQPTPAIDPISACPSGAVCQTGDTQQVACYPGEICEQPEDSTPCFPGTGCETASSLSGDITPPQAQTSCLPGADCILIDTYCAPGKNCNIGQSTTKCLPGKPCEENVNDCVPGSSCTQVITSNTNTTTTNTNTSNTTTTNNDNPCLPGAICSSTNNTTTTNNQTTNTTTTNTTDSALNPTTPSPAPPQIPSNDTQTQDLGCLPGQLC